MSENAITETLPPPAPESFLTARDVSERLQVTVETVLNWHRTGKIPGHRLKGTVRPVRFLWSEVAAAMEVTRVAVQLDLEGDMFAALSADS